jgi:biopolymer transport protein ExbD
MGVTKDQLQVCTTTILECNKEQLQTIKQVINFRLEQLAKELKSKLKAGDEVIVRSRKGVEHGEVVEVKRTRAVVSINDKRYICPLTILSLKE